MTFGGEKASKSRGVGRPLSWYLARFETDGLHNALAQSLPETNDTEPSDDQIVRRINDELVAPRGNLVNRVASMTDRYGDAVVPDPGDLAQKDHDALARRTELLGDAATDAYDTMGRAPTHRGDRRGPRTPFREGGTRA